MNLYFHNSDGAASHRYFRWLAVVVPFVFAAPAIAFRARLGVSSGVVITLVIALLIATLAVAGSFLSRWRKTRRLLAETGSRSFVLARGNIRSIERALFGDGIDATTMRDLRHEERVVLLLDLRPLKSFLCRP